MKQKPKPKPHRERDLSRGWHRNAGTTDDDPADHLYVPAPILDPPPDSSSMALVPYDPRVAAARLPRASLTRRAAAKVRAKARDAVQAVKPEVVNPFNLPHLLQVAAGAGGGIAGALAAHQFGDDVGEKKLAYALTALGAAGSILLDKNWQRVASGILSAGANQLSLAYLNQRTKAKLAKEEKLKIEAQQAAINAINLAAGQTRPTAVAPAPATASTPPRNAYGYIDDGADIYGAVDRAHRAVDDLYRSDARNDNAYGDARNAYPPYGDGAIEVDLADAYAA